MKVKVKVKVCGLTNIDDALAAVNAGADYLGFIIYPKSPRYISPEDVAKITSQVPGNITKVGVFVNPEPELVNNMLDNCGIDIAQFHGEESQEFLGNFCQKNVWKAMHITSAEQLEKMSDYPADTFVVDSMVKGVRGGTGVCCNWDLALQAAQRHKVLLAGGIKPDNAVEAAIKVQPYGLDLASGVEKSPGIKDHNKIYALFKNLKKANLR